MRLHVAGIRRYPEEEEEGSLFFRDKLLSAVLVVSSKFVYIGSKVSRARMVQAVKKRPRYRMKFR